MAAVYFNVLANGIPYLLGTERLKGSHSMSSYHSSELCYLAADLHQPAHHQAADGPVLQAAARRVEEQHAARVAPDILPAGSVTIGEVWIDDKPYTQLRRGRA